MALTFPSGEIRSDKTDHFATSQDPLGCDWKVSWLPSRELSQYNAQKAMQLADAVARHVAKDNAEGQACARSGRTSWTSPLTTRAT
jgi:hypothetical protein